MSARHGTAGPGPMLEIWLVDIVAGEAALHSLGERYELLPPMPPGIAQAANRTSPGNARHQAARIALRALLARHVGLDAARRPFVTGPAGKPGLAAVPRCSPIEFSLAHCEVAALIALSSADAVGVDIEAERSVRINAERRVMLESAASLLSPGEPLPTQPDDRRFLQAWVRLEALAKATGEGISALLGRLGIRGRSLLPVGADGAESHPMFVRDLHLDARSPWHAAIAGAHPHLGTDMPSPVARPLPLDQEFLENLVSGRASDHRPGPIVEGG